MAAFIPPSIATPYHFDIRRGEHGTWIARDRSGLTGGTFVTYKDALRFALSEAGGDSARVHFSAAAKNGGRRKAARPPERAS